MPRIVLCKYRYGLYQADVITDCVLSWNSTGEIGRIGRHLAEKPNVEVTVCLGPMRPIFAVEFQL